MATQSMRLLVADANAPWTRSLFAAMPPRVRADSLRLESLGRLRSGLPGALLRCARPRRLGPNQWEHLRIIPGWTRAYGLSCSIVARWLRRRVLHRMHGGDGTPESRSLPRVSDSGTGPTVYEAETAHRNVPATGGPGRTWVIYTVPQYAGVAERLRSFRGVRQAYYAYDPYTEYEGWAADKVRAWEQTLFAVCDKIIAISEALRQDFQSLSGRKAHYLPNAVSADFLQRMRLPTDRPADLPAPDHGRIVGCIGQINASSYDWNLIDELAHLRPTEQFFFIGPSIEADPVKRAAIDRVLTRPNIRWLGPRPHAALPRYLQHFDLCLNPLAMNPANDRRSPLRLYDYLATDKPILSTAIAEAHRHLPHLSICRSAAEMAAAIERVRSGKYEMDWEARRRYIQANTWEHRAAQLLAILERDDA